MWSCVSSPFFFVGGSTVPKGSSSLWHFLSNNKKLTVFKIYKDASIWKLKRNDIGVGIFPGFFVGNSADPEGSLPF